MKATCAVFLVLFAHQALATDACDKLISSSLKGALAKTFPDFRTPLATDNQEKDIEWYLREGKSGCLGVASGDFDGDGKNDFLLGLTALRGSGALVVVALARRTGWEFKTLGRLPEERFRLYVETGKAGVYRRSEALDGPLRPGEMEVMSCPSSAAIFGILESSGVAHCYVRRKWKHAWISD
jgi:hypothetical protein